MKEKITLLIAVLIVMLGLTACSLKKQPVEIPPVADDEIVSDIEQDEVVEETTSNINFEFLKLENQKENKIYSPLSIKYALKMLEKGASGESKAQISNLLGNQTLTKYESNENMSLANALFIKDTFSSEIKDPYVDTLKNNYDAEVNYDSFENAQNINNWVNEKTFEIVPNIISDNTVSELDFALVNALAIDMDWEEKFIMGRSFEGPSTTFLHEKRNLNNNLIWEERQKKGINVSDILNVSSNTFKNNNEELEVSGMAVFATINNYDILNELGEENIKKIVGDEYRKFAKGEEYDESHASGAFSLSEDVSDAGIEKALEEFFPTYLSELDSNYHKFGTSTDFYIFVDDNVKVFAKDLKEYDGTTLQYVGIMPTTVELDKFIENLDDTTINNYISNLKDISYENFKEGVVTRIYGYIPKFKFEYDLKLKNDLNLLNVTDVFDSEKADLSNMTNGNAYISDALHKASIEFTQDGIKAAAATSIYGAGAGSPFDYQFDVPVEEIDLTFDKPYMFLIRDKETNELWFVGTVYEPLLWENEPEKDAPSGT
ncbi:MAG: hypothetical protein J6B87_07880 [Clostridia bacterium]|nr:hypothetical protein [Clostridia bacterium]